MILKINKLKLLLGLEWANCLLIEKQNVVAEFKNNGNKEFVYIAGKDGDIAVGATAESGYSAAALLSLEYPNALCVLLCYSGEYWVSACVDGQPLSEHLTSSKDEAVGFVRSTLGVMNNVTILGDQEFFSEFFPATESTGFGWDDLVSHASKEALKTSKTAKPSVLNVQYLVLLVLLVGVAFIFWPESEDGNIQAQQDAWEQKHKLEEAAIYQLFNGLITNSPKVFAQTYMSTISKMPTQIAAWELTEINCIKETCAAIWNKQDASGTNADFKNKNKIFDESKHIGAFTEYSNVGDKITTNLALKTTNDFQGNIDTLILKEDFYTNGLERIQKLQKTKLIKITIDVENLSPRLTPSPDGRALKQIEFKYGSWTITGSGLLTIVETADALQANTFSINTLQIKMNLPQMTTWELRGTYAYK